MIPPYLRKMALAVCGVVASALLTMIVEAWTEFNGPGAFAVYYLFPQGRVGEPFRPPDPNEVLFVHLGTDFILFFFALTGLYLLWRKLQEKRDDGNQ
jgi:hypothetical protein